MSQNEFLSKLVSSPNALDSKVRKSPSAHNTIASTSNLLHNNRMNQLNQFYPRPGQIPFHSHPQHHTLSKHFHHMLNHHANLLQNNSIIFDRSGSLNLATNYNHAHPDAITSASIQPHHPAHD